MRVYNAKMHTYSRALKSPHRISHRRPFDKLRERLGFCDSPSRGE